MHYFLLPITTTIIDAEHETHISIDNIATAIISRKQNRYTT